MNPKDTQKDIATDVDYIDPSRVDIDPSVTESQPKRRVGRPRKSEVEAKKKGNRGQVGRPKGDAAALNEFKARLIASPKSRKVFDSILNAALDDEHKNQAVAWKLLMDRLLPVGMFEQDVTKGNQRASVNITISGVGGETVNIGGGNDDTLEGDYEEV